MLEWLAKNSLLVTANPWPFFIFFVLSVLGSAAFFRWFYAERIALLKDRIDHPKDTTGGKSEVDPAKVVDEPLRRRFEYPASGLYGMNILGLGVNPLVVGQYYSMRAVIPPGRTLQVQLSGPGVIDLTDSGGAWGFSTSTRNWAHQPYVESTSTPEQWFQAVAGEADLMFFPRRQGELIVRAFEDGADPVFERRMRVIQAAR
ncbi:hypothetical protein [Luteibacter yeojuensis]